MKQDYSELSLRYAGLEADYDELNASYSSLQIPYEQLVTKYTKLVTDYRKLNDSYAQLKAIYDQGDQISPSMLEYYTSLSSNVTSLNELLHSYTLLPESFTRVLDSDAVRETSSTVLDVTGSSKDSWSSYQKIYDFLTSNIKYVKDVDMPYISYYWYVTSGGFRYITSFSLDTVRNYIQTPGLTLEIKQGDCDDQAILAYSTIQYYRNYILGNFYSLYIAEIKLSNGSWHVAVIMPVSGGEICVVDPAGNYLTTSGGKISSKQALVELQAYSSHWSKSAGTIVFMKLYNVDITDGSYDVVAEGTLNQVAAFLK